MKIHIFIGMLYHILPSKSQRCQVGQQFIHTSDWREAISRDQILYVQNWYFHIISKDTTHNYQ